MEQEYAISCHKIAISWKPICRNWKSFVINDALCLGLFGGGNLELPRGNLEFPHGRFTTKSSLCHHFVHVIYNRTLPIIKEIGFQQMAIKKSPILTPELNVF